MSNATNACWWFTLFAHSSKNWHISGQYIRFYCFKCWRDLVSKYLGQIRYLLFCGSGRMKKWYATKYLELGRFGFSILNRLDSYLTPEVPVNKSSNRRYSVFYSFIFLKRWGLTFHVNRLPSRRFTWNVKPYHLWKLIIKKKLKKKTNIIYSQLLFWRTH